jgi:Glycosyl transferase family 11
VFKRGIMVHIRRTDYVSSPHKHGILNAHYFERAIKLMQSMLDHRAPIVVFSDDVPWCKSLEFLRDAMFVDEPSEVKCLYLMS